MKNNQNIKKIEKSRNSERSDTYRLDDKRFKTRIFNWMAYMRV